MDMSYKTGLKNPTIIKAYVFSEHLRVVPAGPDSYRDEPAT